MSNLTIYNKFREVPQEAKKEIGAGRLKGFTDINPMWRIKMLTEQFGVCGFGWYFDIVEQKIIEGSDNQKSAFVTINLFVKMNDEWSKPIVGVGGSSFVTNERNGAYTSDECFKMALTDALSIACKNLGIGADVYFAKDRTKYDQEQNAAIPIENIIADIKSVNSRTEFAAMQQKYAMHLSNEKVIAACKEVSLKYPKPL